MHLSASLLVLATALGAASAHPSLHHRHGHLHNERTLAVGESIEPRGAKWVKASKPKSSPPAASPSPVASPVSTPPSTPAPAGNGAFVPFCGGSSSTSKRATQADIAAVGNIGNGKYGCNIMAVDCAALDKYDYGVKFDTTSATGSYSCSAFNKIGPDGVSINGFWTSVLDFTISSGETKCIAIDQNSQGGFACGPGTGGAPRTSLNQLAGSWYEFDYGSKRNVGNSGSDVSVLVAADYGLPYIGMAVRNPAGDLCSWVKSNGENFAAYMPGMHALDGVGCTGYYKGIVKVTLGD